MPRDLMTQDLMDALCARSSLHTPGPLPSLCNIDHTNIVMWNGSAGASRSGRRRPPRGADQFRKQAKECRQWAATALKAVDKAFWLRLAEDWLKLAQEADNPTKRR
jgi:hypothetical protein